jgi:hypothetical protein
VTSSDSKESGGKKTRIMIFISFNVTDHQIKEGLSEDVDKLLYAGMLRSVNHTFGGKSRTFHFSSLLY